MTKLRRRKKVNEAYGLAGYVGDKFDQPFVYGFVQFPQHLMEPKVEKPENERYISVGCFIGGYGYHDRRYYEGTVTSIERDGEGYVNSVDILNKETRQIIRLTPDKIKLLR